MRLDGLTITDTEYTHDKVDWHYHENAYFTFILQGNVIEGNKKEVYHCSAGSLLFHNWEEPHYNIKPAGYTRGFHIEIERNWFNDSGFFPGTLRGNIRVTNPASKLLFHKIFKETKINDTVTGLALEDLLMKTLVTMQQSETVSLKTKPNWVSRVKEILHDTVAENFSLTELARNAGIHPVHLSRHFSKYFHTTLGDYTRKLKTEKALSLLPDKGKSLMAISFDCGFADQAISTVALKK